MKRSHVVYFWFKALPAWLILASAILPGTALASGKNEVKFEAEKRSLLIGEQIRIHLEVKAGATERIFFPVFRDTLIRQIEIISQSPIDTLFPDNDVSIQILSQDLVVTSFDTGYLVIPPIAIRLGADTLKTLPILLEVKSVEVEAEGDIKDIKQPLEVDFSFWEWVLEHWIWLASVLFIFIAISVYYLFFYKKKPEVITQVVAPVKKPHKIALEKLEAIREKKLWQNGQVKAYHSEISEVLREYIEKRFQVNALEQTTDEIFHNLRYLDITDANKNKLRQVLMLSDMVKFAKEKPVSTENELSLSNGIDFVESTKEVSNIAGDTGTQTDKTNTAG